MSKGASKICLIDMGWDADPGIVHASYFFAILLREDPAEYALIQVEDTNDN